MQVISIIFSAIAGYLSLRITSHPNSRLNKHLPKIKVKWIELLPSIRIVVRGRIIHLHHWFSFTILLCISIFVNGGLLDSWLTRGFLMGGIIQGLRFPDRGIFKSAGK